MSLLIHLTACESAIRYRREALHIKANLITDLTGLQTHKHSVLLYIIFLKLKITYQAIYCVRYHTVVQTLFSSGTCVCGTGELIRFCSIASHNQASRSALIKNIQLKSVL